MVGASLERVGVREVARWARASDPIRVDLRAIGGRVQLSVDANSTGAGAPGAAIAGGRRRDRRAPGHALRGFVVDVIDALALPVGLLSDDDVEAILDFVAPTRLGVAGYHSGGQLCATVEVHATRRRAARRDQLIVASELHSTVTTGRGGAAELTIDLYDGIRFAARLLCRATQWLRHERRGEPGRGDDGDLRRLLPLIRDRVGQRVTAGP